ncbi:hypothetical protein JXA31_10180 [Candidatus Bathyarchaeota archaeon]|nr:hypothetical protein [Candidatus Bathyarchaeota archaeon]
MVSSTVDHMVAITVFLAATLLFIGLFNQTIQTAVIYQRHRATATKASDLLDNMLLTPGIPINWGQNDSLPTGFGLQDPEFTQYKISSFSLMRLNSTSGTSVNYWKTGSYYSNITVGSKNFLLLSQNSVLNYSTALDLLGIRNQYGFQLTVKPIVTVSVTENRAAGPLSLSLDVYGTGFPLANAHVTYCLMTVELDGADGYPAYTTYYGTDDTDEKGSVTLSFSQVIDSDVSYALIAYAYLGGLVGVGYHERVSSGDAYAIPFVDNLSEGRVLIAHSYDIEYAIPPSAELRYNASLVYLAEDFTLREMPLESSYGRVNSSDVGVYGVVNIPTDNPGILIIPYQTGANEGGMVMMPWGVSPLAFPVVFGGDPRNQEWVATDMRQIIVGGITYQVTLALWSLEGYQVVG